MNYFRYTFTTGFLLVATSSITIALIIIVLCLLLKWFLLMSIAISLEAALLSIMLLGKYFKWRDYKEFDHLNN